MMRLLITSQLGIGVWSSLQVALIGVASLFAGCAPSATYELCGKNETAADITDSSVQVGKLSAGWGYIAVADVKRVGLFDQPVAQTAVVSWTDISGGKHAVTVSMAPRVGKTPNGWITFHIRPADVVTVEFEDRKD